jgi:hypothetical protein
MMVVLVDAQDMAEQRNERQLQVVVNFKGA